MDSPTLTVTLSVLNGSVAIVPGLALLAGNLTDTVTISGTLAEVNLALASVYYLGNPNFNGSDTLTVTTSDGALSDIDHCRDHGRRRRRRTGARPRRRQFERRAGRQAIDTTFTENGPPVALTDTDLVLTDVDSANLVGATFVLLNAQAGDALVVTGSLPGGISAVVTGNQLTLSGSASVADYKAALALIAFENPGDAPDPQDRLIQVTVNDGTETTSAFTLVQIITVNDAPVNTVPGAQSVNEDTALPIAGVSVADADSPALTTTLTVTSGTLSVTTGGGATILGNGTAAVTLSGSAAQINAALAGLSYTGNLNFNGSDTLTVTTGDGTAQDIDTVAITVNPVNDAPVNTVPGRAERQRGHGAADRRCVGRGRGQPGADHHADGDQRHAQRDDGWRRNDRRQRQRCCHAFGKRHPDQRGARRPLLHRQSQLQRLRHAHRHHRRRHRAGHRHGRHHRQPR